MAAAAGVAGFRASSSSGGLCTLTLNCGGGSVGLSCDDTDCVCVDDGRGGTRFDIAGACGMSTETLTSVYEARCAPAVVDAGAGADAGPHDGGAPDVPPVVTPCVSSGAVDLLFVIDNSSSMAANQATLARSISGLFNGLVNPISARHQPARRHHLDRPRNTRRHHSVVRQQRRRRRRVSQPHPQRRRDSRPSAVGHGSFGDAPLPLPVRPDAVPEASFTSVKPGRPGNVVFAALAGVPIQFPQTGSGDVDWEALLGSNPDGSDGYTGMSPEGPVSMRQRNMDPSCSTRVVPACRHEGSSYDPMRPPCSTDQQYFALPSRRVAEVARRFAATYQTGTVSSICRNDYGQALDGVERLIGSRLCAR